VAVVMEEPQRALQHTSIHLTCDFAHEAGQGMIRCWTNFSESLWHGHAGLLYMSVQICIQAAAACATYL